MLPDPLCPLRIMVYLFCRLSGAHTHYYIHDFLQKIATRYQESGRAGQFVLDLLSIRVSKLLAVEPGGEESKDEEVQQSFKQFVQVFIRKNALKRFLLSNMTIIMVMCMNSSCPCEACIHVHVYPYTISSLQLYTKSLILL